MNDARDPARVEREAAEMARQRFHGLLAGYEDCNDHDTRRGDPPALTRLGDPSDDRVPVVDHDFSPPSSLVGSDGAITTSVFEKTPAARAIRSLDE